MINKESVFYNKSNLEILQDIKEEYNPKTAFGNARLLKLLDSIKQPNKDGIFETTVGVEKFRIVRASWKCVDCGKENLEELEQEDVREDDMIERICNNCNKKHKLTIVAD